MTPPSEDPTALRDLTAALWPDVTAAPVPTKYRILPSSDEPRLLIPTTPRRAAGRLVWALRDRVTLGARVRTHVLQVGLRSGLAGLADHDVLRPPGRGIEAALAELLGTDVVIGIHIGPPRANRKPVMAVSTPHGRILGYAKLGVGPLSDRLVANEQRALEQLAASGPASLSPVVVPTLLGATTFNGHPLLVQSPLPVHGTRAADAVAHRRAQVAVARAFSTQRRPIDDSPYVAAVTARVEELGDRGAALRTVLAGLDGNHGVTLGAWHGDWRPANVAADGDRILVWDWERFDREVPIGFDALHQTLTTATRAGLPPDQLPEMLKALAPGLLEPFGVPGGDAPTVVSLYFIELATRYLADDQLAAGARLGDVNRWLLPHLTGKVS
jgi:hypothetical protein